MASRRSRLGAVTTLLVPVLACVALGSGVSAASAEAAPSGPPSSAVAGSGGLDAAFLTDLFTAAARPLELSVKPAPDLAASATIGPEGGRVEAKGADGTTYALDVPKDALAMPTTITLTPLSDASGFPVEATPAHVLGVDIAPHGFPLAVPARLAVDPPADIAEAGLAALAVGATGNEASLAPAEARKDGLTVPLDRLGGRVVVAGLDALGVRALAGRLPSGPNERLQAAVAAVDALGSLSATSQPAGGTPADLGSEVLGRFVDAVLRPAVESATGGEGCAEADAAMQALLDYGRSRTALGLERDTASDLGAADWLAPADLAAAVVQRCFPAAEAACAQDGDVNSLLAYEYATLRRIDDGLGVAPTEDQIGLAREQVAHCGRYHLAVTSSARSTDRPRGQLVETAADLGFDLAWAPGPGKYGLIGSTIAGTSDVDVSQLHWETASCPDGYHTSGIRSVTPGAARLESLTFDPFRGPVVDPAAPAPTAGSLIVDLGFGSFDYQNACQGSKPQQVEERFTWAGLATKKVDKALSSEFGSVAARLDEGWAFSAQPFTAEQILDGRFRIGRPRYDAHVEASLQHQPQ